MEGIKKLIELRVSNNEDFCILYLINASVNQERCCCVQHLVGTSTAEYLYMFLLAVDFGGHWIG